MKSQPTATGAGLDGTFHPAATSTATSGPFNLLAQLHADEPMVEIFSERSMVAFWLEVEAALAAAQAELGILSVADAEAIGAVTADAIDLPQLWRETANVGYPILPLVRQIAGRLEPGPDGRVHFGATTQDIMDSGLALQLRAAIARLEVLGSELARALCRQVRQHCGTVMAARTHGQQAVPSTLGAKLAVYLDELGRHRDRLGQLRQRVCAVSMFGAGGTGAAYGPRIRELRHLVARRLELETVNVPWHVARDGLAEFGFVSAAMAETCARLAREVIDLSRTEIAELREADGHHRGASSTMPQKANPISAEAIVGLAVSASAQVPPLLRAMEAGHERAAGEWQIEWEVLPRVACSAAAALRTSAAMVTDLQVDSEAMRANLAVDGGAIMAEAYMIRLAPVLGRERAHDLVYAAVRSARSSGRSLDREIAEGTPEAVGALGEDLPLSPDHYLGESRDICEAALARWQETVQEEPT